MPDSTSGGRPPLDAPTKQAAQFAATRSAAAQLVATRSVDASGEQAWNEEQLSRPVTAPVACLWCYPEPAVVLGRSQQALLASLAEPASPASRRGRHHRLVARSSGGGAVLVGPWLLGASVALPTGHRLIDNASVADSYRWLGELFVQALAQHGVHALAVPRERTRKAAHDLEWACFAGISPWEVAVDDRKLVGFAQRRSRHGVLLVAGALLRAVPWEDLCETMQRPAAQAGGLAATTIDASQLLGRPLPAPVLAETVAGLMVPALAD